MMRHRYSVPSTSSFPHGPSLHHDHADVDAVVRTVVVAATVIVMVRALVEHRGTAARW